MPALLAIEKIHVFQAGGESHMAFVKDGGPLHGGTVKFLARQTVADFRIHGIGANLVANTPAKAGGPIFGDKRRVVYGRIFWSESVSCGMHVNAAKIPCKSAPADAPVHQGKGR